MQTKGNPDAKVQTLIPVSLEMYSGSDRKALSGTELARALIEHVAYVGATGYVNEFVVGGEVWAIGIAKGNSKWHVT